MHKRREDAPTRLATAAFIGMTVFRGAITPLESGTVILGKQTQFPSRMERQVVFPGGTRKQGEFTGQKTDPTSK